MYELTDRNKTALRRLMADGPMAELMDYLKSRTPRVRNITSDTELAFNSGKAEGYRECIDDIEAIFEVDKTKGIEIENR